MVPLKFELFDIQNTLSISTVIAVQVTHVNIKEIPSYLEGVFCKTCTLVDGEELRIVFEDETIIVHPMEYIIIDKNFKLFTLNERSFKILYSKRGII